MTKIKKLKRVVVKEELVALTGKVDHAIVLNQFIYWSERVKDVDKYIEEEIERSRKFSDGSVENIEDMKENLSNGWIYKTAKEMKDECMFEKSATTMERIFNYLADNGWLDRRRNPKYKWDKTYQYRVNLLKIQQDLNHLGYALEGYSLGNFNQVEEAKVQNEDSKLQDEETKVQNEDSRLQNEEAKVQNEDLRLQNEQSKVQNEEAIPEITTKTTSDSTNKNLNPNPSKINKYDLLWEIQIPSRLKIKIKVLLQDQSINLSPEQILLIEDAYFYQRQKGFIIPDCSSDDVTAINDYEFSATVEKMLETVKSIDNMRGLIQSWVQTALHYKKEYFLNSTYSSKTDKSVPFYDWLNNFEKNTANYDDEMPY